MKKKTTYRIISEQILLMKELDGEDIMDVYPELWAIEDYSHGFLRNEFEFGSHNSQIRMVARLLVLKGYTVYDNDYQVVQIEDTLEQPKSN